MKRKISKGGYPPNPLYRKCPKCKTKLLYCEICGNKYCAVCGHECSNFGWGEWV